MRACVRACARSWCAYDAWGDNVAAFCRRLLCCCYTLSSGCSASLWPAGGRLVGSIVWISCAPGIRGLTRQTTTGSRRRTRLPKSTYAPITCTGCVGEKGPSLPINGQTLLRKADPSQETGRTTDGDTRNRCAHPFPTASSLRACAPLWHSTPRTLQTAWPDRMFTCYTGAAAGPRVV